MASEARTYVYGKNMPQLFESMMTALMYEQPEDPVEFLENCLAQVRATNLTNYDWATFNRLIVKKEECKTARQGFTAMKPLPPIGNGQEPTEHGVDSSNQNGSAVNSRVDIGDKLVIFVLGGPGCGKGTQCAKIVEEFGFKHISAGDLLRQEVTKESEQGKEIKEIMAQGKLVPPEITVTLLRQAILSTNDEVGILIDGFPREVSQSNIFEEQVCEGSLVLVLECSEDVMVERLMERGKTSKRVDDNEETIRKRLHTYNESTVSVIDHFQSQNKVRKIDADGSVDEVYTQVQALFRELTGQASAADSAESAEGQTKQKQSQGEETEKLVKKPIIFVLGGPGSGKGTQCAKIVEEFEYKHISAGDLLRQEVAKESEQGKEIKEIMAQGKLVPAEVIVKLLKQTLLANSGEVGFLLDGFPRNFSQGKAFEQEVCEGSLVLVFECSEDVMMKRLAERSETSGRVDDNEETIRKRLATFKECELPVIEHYEKLDKVRKVDAGRSEKEVYADVQKILKEFSSQE